MSLSKSDLISEARRKAGLKGARALWGDRGQSRTVRVTLAAYAALQSVPSRDRRDVASAAILAALAAH